MDPDPVMFRDTFWPGTGQKCLVLPFGPAKAGQKAGQKVTKKRPVLSLFGVY